MLATILENKSCTYFSLVAKFGAEKPTFIFSHDRPLAMAAILAAILGGKLMEICTSTQWYYGAKFG